MYYYLEHNKQLKHNNCKINNNNNSTRVNKKLIKVSFTVEALRLMGSTANDLDKMK